MVIKYKAKYIRDGEVVIDDSSLIELGGDNSGQQSGANGHPAKRDNAWEQMIAQSEQRSKDVDPKDSTESDKE